MRVVGSFRFADHIVVGERIGWLHLDRANTPTLVTHDGYLPLTAETPCRPTMGGARATELLQMLVRGETIAESLAEIAFDLRISLRRLHATVQHGDGSAEPLESPLGFSEHDYLGTFEVREELIVADRCYVAETRELLACATPAVAGTWCAFIRYDLPAVNRSLALLVVHAAHLADAEQNGEVLGRIGVDSGSVVVVDASARAHAARFGDGERAWLEGIVDGLGVFAYTANGDGLYPARVFRRDGRATMIRASLLGAEHALYRLPKAPVAASYVRAVDAELASGSAELRAYSTKTKFAVGDRIHHVKFGEGVVRTLLPDNKMEVAFRDGPRALVHGR